MNNVAAPTVSGPTMNLQGFSPIAMPISELPKVTCVADAKQYPGKNGSEDVLLDQNDPDLAYFRRIDSNGFVQVDRRRCIAEPEPTQEELNDKRYLSREEFTSFMDQFKAFREEMSENVRVLAATAAANQSGTGKSYGKPYNKQHSNGQVPDAGSQAVQES